MKMDRILDGIDNEQIEIQDIHIPQKKSDQGLHIK